MEINPIQVLEPFTLILLAELGDKTQICIIMLSARSPALSIFLGALAAFFIVDGLSALLGGELLSLLPESAIRIISSVAFIAFGVYSLVRREEDGCACEAAGVSFIKTFSLVAFMELGDKTNLLSIILAAKMRNPLIALIGIMMAFAIISGMGVFFGNMILRVIPKKYLQKAAAITFIALGIARMLVAI